MLLMIMSLILIVCNTTLLSGRVFDASNAEGPQNENCTGLKNIMFISVVHLGKTHMLRRQERIFVSVGCGKYYNLSANIGRALDWQPP